MLEGIVDTIHEAMSAQQKFNEEWTPEKRAKAFYNHPVLMDRILQKHRLTCICTDCSAVMDSFHSFSETRCEVCRSVNIVSEYHC